MKKKAAILIIMLATLSGCSDRLRSQTEGKTAYLGFDRNEYPGDETLVALRRKFSFTGYWLNTPPGATGNSWAGKRDAARAAGFGFLVLFNGRLDAELKKKVTRAHWASPMPQLPRRPPGTKGSQLARSSFWTSKRAGACCPSRKPISTRGSMASVRAGFEPESIVQAFPLRRE